MSRLDTMARFAEPEDEPEYIECDACGDSIYVGESCWDYHGSIYCSTNCVAYSVATETVYGE